MFDPQILAAVVTVLLTATAAVADYVLRKRILQAKPFIAVISVDGDMWRGATRATVPETVLAAMKITPIAPTRPSTAKIS